MGLTFLFGGFPTPPDEAFPIRLFGALFVIIPLALILSGWALAVSKAVSGYFLSKKQRHTFCLVVAGVECIFIPFDTILGVFTIILLTRPGIREVFAS